MGRTRKRDRHLPQRVYHRKGAYYYVERSGTWRRLASDYRDALCALAGILGAAAPGNNIEQLVARYTVEELAGKSTKTARGRAQEFKMVVRVFGHMGAETIEPHHVWNYWKQRGCTEQARHEIRALSALLTFARRVGARTQPNPCFGLQLPRAKPRSRYVTDAEYGLVKGLAPPMMRHAMELAVTGGFDEGTIRRLERRHLVKEGISFERGKTAKWQLIEWNDDLRRIVREIQGQAPQLRRALICNRRGQAYTANGFQSQWQRLMRKAMKAGLTERFHFHDLRAKSASDAGSDQEAADRLGHADVKMTREVYRRQPRRAIALRILDRKP